MARNELGEAVYDGDDRFLEIPVLHAGCTPQRAGAAMLRPAVEVRERYCGMLISTYSVAMAGIAV